jgi:inosine triphosphate pyrophosphatase
MTTIFLVTGNANKLKEWQAILPADMPMEAIDLDLPEIQSIDPKEIVADKARRAFEAARKPVVVEDVSVALAKLNGLPGPFVKFFLKALGSEALYILAGGEDEKATVSCSVAYFDGTTLLTDRADVPGKIVSSRGTDGFGFDATFIPDGFDLTYAEMTPEQKNGISHRSRAIKMFIDTFHEHIQRKT